MKILFVLEHFHPYIGGVETLFASLGKSLAEHGHEVSVITSRFDPKLSKTERWQNMHIQRIPLSNRFSFTFLGALWIWRQAGNCDLIHTTSYNAAFPAWICGKLRKKPVILTFHEVWGKLWFQLPWLSWAQRFVYGWYERWLLKLPFHQYVAVSNSTMKAMVMNGVPSSKIRVIYNGLDYSFFERYKTRSETSDSQRFQIMYYGRLGVAKGLDIVFQMLRSEVIMQLPIRWHLVLPERPESLLRKISAVLDEIRQHPSVEVTHNLPQEALFKKLANCDAVLIPSYSEGFCFVAAEAMALGVPIIHSNRGALKEVVGGKQLAIPAFPTLEGMTEILKRAINGDWDQKPSRRFPLSKAVGNYESLYREVCSAP